MTRAETAANGITGVLLLICLIVAFFVIREEF